MTEKKRRQEHKNKPLCIKCGEGLKKTYTKEIVSGKHQYVPMGWVCPSETCDYITKEFVESEEETESFYEIEND